MCAPTKYVGVPVLTFLRSDSQWTGRVKKAVFLHVFKTGGTSLQQWLAEHYESRFVPSDPSSFRDQLQGGECGVRKHNLIAGHMFAEHALRFSDTHTTLTVLRKPEAQLMSALWHVYVNDESARSKKFDPGSLPALIEVAEQLTATGAGMQALFFAPSSIDMSDPNQRKAKTGEALGRLAHIDVVGITERMPETFQLFAHRLGIEPPEEVPHFRNAGSGLHGLTPELREILKHHLEIDQQLYDAAVRRFERDLSGMKPRWAFWR